MPRPERSAGGHLVIGLSVCLSVRLPVRLSAHNSVPAYKQSAIFKVWVMIQ